MMWIHDAELTAAPRNGDYTHAGRKEKTFADIFCPEAFGLRRRRWGGGQGLRGPRSSLTGAVQEPTPRSRWTGRERTERPGPQRPVRLASARHGQCDRPRAPCPQTASTPRRAGRPTRRTAPPQPPRAGQPVRRRGSTFPRPKCCPSRTPPELPRPRSRSGRSAAADPCGDTDDVLSASPLRLPVFHTCTLGRVPQSRCLRLPTPEKNLPPRDKRHPGQSVTLDSPAPGPARRLRSRLNGVDPKQPGRCVRSSRVVLPLCADRPAPRPRTTPQAAPPAPFGTEQPQANLHRNRTVRACRLRGR